MQSSVELLREERRRKLQVRELFARGLPYYRPHPLQGLRFLLAAADYLVTGQRRLIAQDRRLVATLAPRVPAAQQDDHAAMAALRGRLELAERSLEDFAAATADLRTRGAAAFDDFSAAADRFLDLLVNVLGARSHSLRHLTTTLLSEDDWRAIVDATPEFIAAESETFAAVERLTPAPLRTEKGAPPV